jgi:hypothetical protein
MMPSVSANSPSCQYPAQEPNFDLDPIIADLKAIYFPNYQEEIENLKRDPRVATAEARIERARAYIQFASQKKDHFAVPGISDGISSYWFLCLCEKEVKVAFSEEEKKLRQWNWEQLSLPKKCLGYALHELTRLGKICELGLARISELSRLRQIAGLSCACLAATIFIIAPFLVAKASSVASIALVSGLIFATLAVCILGTGEKSPELE